MAIESDLITCDVVEATGFPHLVYKYGVYGVPKTIVNEKTSIDGSLPEDNFVEKVWEALKE